MEGYRPLPGKLGTPPTEGSAVAKPDPFPLGFVAHINAKMWPYPDGWHAPCPKAREAEQKAYLENLARLNGRPYL